ncbi:hypothetical protein SAMN03159341_101304 [Paenibacillus sp. 1_12]|uniref:Cna B-type domain-containing protein n=1 Tax=Paenibacillus sp. 1_12 TaxID=1566278 RepID=UPI0008F12FDD|nr:Cna B-type domain-containing protein [Paenibacillus sp. 1_12]SFK73021.1 hypothetical protein SAMN03159341_101304 [Paenibacillus sp. 1_12]
MMKKALKFLTVSIMLWACLLGLSSMAFADAAMDFEITSVAYENGVLTAVGKFQNTGDKSIADVTKVDVKIILHNDAGDSKEVANHYFTDLKLNVKPGEAVDYTLTFSDVPEYTDATSWTAEEGDWEFTYIEDAPAAEEPAPAPAEEAAPAALDFSITSVSYEDGNLTAVGNFSNTGGKNIDEVQKVSVKIILHNDAGDSKEVANQYFTDLPLHLKPTESKEYTLIFNGVPEYTDATSWTAEEGEWEFTFFE